MTKGTELAEPALWCQPIHGRPAICSTAHKNFGPGWIDHMAGALDPQACRFFANATKPSVPTPELTLFLAQAASVTYPDVTTRTSMTPSTESHMSAM